VHNGQVPDGLTMVTNDLNMLLKAQTYGLEVERYADGPDGGFAKRYIIRPFQRYRVPLGILGTSLAVFAAIIVRHDLGPRCQRTAPTWCRSSSAISCPPPSSESSTT
jgi:hypothetical protein